MLTSGSISRSETRVQGLAVGRGDSDRDCPDRRHSTVSLNTECKDRERRVYCERFRKWRTEVAWAVELFGCRKGRNACSNFR